MKRKKAQLCLLVASFLFVGYNTYKSQHTNHEAISSLAQANIEALAFGEWDPIEGWTCFWDVYDDVSSSTFFICQRCGNCYTVSATAAYGPGHCWH